MISSFILELPSASNSPGGKSQCNCQVLSLKTQWNLIFHFLEQLQLIFNNSC